jgi:hypothetical protein
LQADFEHIERVAYDDADGARDVPRPKVVGVHDGLVRGEIRNVCAWTRGWQPRLGQGVADGRRYFAPCC